MPLLKSEASPGLEQPEGAAEQQLSFDASLWSTQYKKRALHHILLGFCLISFTQKDLQ